MSPLVWSPIHRILEERIRANDDIILIVVPFAKLAALQQLHRPHSTRAKLKVICRWRPEDIIAGVSDVEVFTYLKELGCQLFINPDIHLKLYVFASNVAFSTSGNLTSRGLGYSEIGNIEVGNMVALTTQDWTKIYEIVNASRQVDDILYERYKELVKKYPITPQPLVPNLLPPAKTYTISSLPATETPKRLAEFYFDFSSGTFTPEEVRRAVHDLAIFRIPPHLGRSDFDKRLGESFCRTAFVADFVQFLKSAHSLRFGAVNDWIHQRCEDVPVPYRWEIKENTRILYNWLTHFYSEISWDIPGEYSQVIYWRGSVAAGESDNDSPATTLANYQRMLAHLTNREQGSEWGEKFRGGAPHQPLLILAVIGLYEQNPGRSNFIVINEELQELFRRYFELVVVPYHPTSIIMPFLALREEPFWHLLRHPGVVEQYERIRSLAAFNQIYRGATLDDDLHRVLSFSANRKAIQDTIVQSYLAEGIQTVLLEYLRRPARP
jgi:hypothetical protein